MRGARRRDTAAGGGAAVASDEHARRVGGFAVARTPTAVESRRARRTAVTAAATGGRGRAGGQRRPRPGSSGDSLRMRRRGPSLFVTGAVPSSLRALGDPAAGCHTCGPCRPTPRRAGAPSSRMRLLGPLAADASSSSGASTPTCSSRSPSRRHKVVAVEPSLDLLDAARARPRGDISAELHNVDFADLAFVHADTIDAAVAVQSLAAVDDLDRISAR